MDTVSLVYDFLFNALPMPKKPSHSGWTKVNGHCCPHNGESRVDTRMRAGITNDGTKVSYHCFNCGFSTAYTGGRYLPKKMISLLMWLGADPTEIKRLSFTIYSGGEQPIDKARPLVSQIYFKDTSLPIGAKPFKYWLEREETSRDFVDAVTYLDSRGSFLLNDLTWWYWTPSQHANMSRRVIVPFWWNDKIVGWTCRAIDQNMTRYYSNQPPGFLYNNAILTSPTTPIIYITEGLFDAIVLNGVALLGSSITKTQIEWITRAKKPVVVIPDRDAKKTALVEIALNNGWGVSFAWGLTPHDAWWGPNIKDVSDAAQHYGQLFTMRTVIEGTTFDRIKIQTLSKLIS